MNQIIVNLPGFADTVIQAVDIDDAVVKLQDLQSKPVIKQCAIIHKFKGIARSNVNDVNLELDWHKQ